MKVKYTNSKWFLENNGEWIEIAEKDWDKVKDLCWGEYEWDLLSHEWEPTPDTEYKLDNVGFEIKVMFYLKGLNLKVDTTQQSEVEEKEKNIKIVSWTDGSFKEIIDGITWEFEGDKDWLQTIDINKLSLEKISIDGNKSFAYQKGFADCYEVFINKSEVERLREENEDLKIQVQLLKDDSYSTGYQIGKAEQESKIKELESKLSQYEKSRGSS